MRRDRPKLDELIRLLDLKPHPSEGGFFRETYRSDESLPRSALPTRYSGARSFGTAIYYLVTPDSFSAMHRLQSDEVFHYYIGDPVRMLTLFPDGRGEVVVMGSDVADGHKLQHVVPRGVWDGMSLIDGGEYALLGATVAPGFEYDDFELADRDELIAAHPAQADLIRKLTHPKK